MRYVAAALLTALGGNDVSAGNIKKILRLNIVTYHRQTIYDIPVFIIISFLVPSVLKLKMTKSTLLSQTWLARA